MWDNPELGRIPASEFIPIAEDTGMILSIGGWVLQQVCRQVAEWEHAGLRPVPVAVNVSALQFAQQDFVSTVADALRTANAPPSAIELELTESLIMRDVDTSASLMRDLREIGVKIAIDDFGTGYSSLSYLRRLPADSLKIDKSFLQESEFGPATMALIRAVVVLAHSTGLKVTAEGVESSDQLELVREAGCDRVQGHLFGAACQRTRPSDCFASVTSKPVRTLLFYISGHGYGHVVRMSLVMRELRRMHPSWRILARTQAP